MGMNAIELKDVIEKHHKWLKGEPEGERANLSYADLSYADLSYANLSYADLSSANLRSANLGSANLRSANLRSADLSYADLSSTNLRSADLSYADLSYANLSSIQQDFFARLALAKHEVTGLYDYLMKGKIDGRSYKGECACFVGTIAKVANEDYEKLSSGLKPEESSATERWFMGIRAGDLPQSNQVSDVTRIWIEEFSKEHSIALPSYKIISSAEFPAAF